MRVMGDHQKLSEALVHDILEKAERAVSVQPGEERSKGDLTVYSIRSVERNGYT